LAHRVSVIGSANRQADGHDILATYRLLTDERALRAVPADYEAFENMLRSRHALLMSARPENRPGEFKTTKNSVGRFEMVLPNLVVGTLRLGFDMLRGLTEPFARGLFLHCLIAEVHPFDDGNGRMSRLHFTSELLRGGAGPRHYSDRIPRRLYRRHAILELAGRSGSDRAGVPARTAGHGLHSAADSQYKSKSVPGPHLVYGFLTRSPKRHRPADL
jgi:hypothetical protein